MSVRRCGDGAGAEEGDFLGRWSRLKRTRAREDEGQGAAALDDRAAAPVQGGEVQSGAAGPDTRTDDEILAELGLPHPDTLKPGDDFSAFLSKAVPDHLRRIALRKLWGSNPVLANLDELVDYGEDFTDAATVVENLQTAYQVGRGYKRDPEPDAEPEVTLDAGPTDDGGDANETAGNEPDDMPDQLSDDTEGAQQNLVTDDEPDAASGSSHQATAANQPNTPVEDVEIALNPPVSRPYRHVSMPRSRMKFHQAD